MCYGGQDGRGKGLGMKEPALQSKGGRKERRYACFVRWCKLILGKTCAVGIMSESNDIAATKSMLCEKAWCVISLYVFL